MSDILLGFQIKSTIANQSLVGRKIINDSFTVLTDQELITLSLGSQ